MNKKLWTIIVSVLLIVTMSVCLFACSDADTDASTGAKSSLKMRNGSAGSSSTKGIQIGPNSTIAIESTVDTSATDIATKFAFTTKDGESVGVILIQNDTKHYSIKAPNGGYAEGWYNLALLDSTLSFTQYPGTSKLSISVVSDDVNAALAEDVVYLAAGSAAIYGFSEPDAPMSTFMFDSTIAGEMIKMGDIVLVQDEAGNYAAYKIWGVSATDEAGVYTVAYQVPKYSDVYSELHATSTATVSEETVEYANYGEAVDALVNEVSAAGFNVGPVRVDANFNKVTNTVDLTVKVTVNDVLGDKDGANSLNLIFTFGISSKITADTDINIGALIKKEDNEVKIDAKFENTLTFTVAAEDGANISEVAGLDSIILKIKNMIQKTSDDALSVPVFNWIVPIGNGVADVNFQVNAVLDFTFSGKIGVVSTATADFKAIISYNPATEEKTVKFEELKKFSIDSVEIDLDANATVYAGIEAAIKFELLAGVLSVGVGAEVGNYNRIYGSLHTDDLIEVIKKEKEFGANYGYYFEGGIYYDVKFLYSIAGIKSGDISFLGGRQEKELYTSGSRYVVSGLYDSYMTVSNVEQDIVIDCIYRDIVTGEQFTNPTNIIDATKIKEISEDSANDYVTISKGKIVVSNAAISAGLHNYEVVVEADGVQASIFITTVQATHADQNSLVSGLDIPAGTKTITAEYVDGTALDVTMTKEGKVVTAAEFTTAGVGTIVVKADGVVIAIYKVA